jgi:hypothetical protein
MIDNNLKMLFALPFILIGLSFLISESISFKPVLTPQESAVVNFEPEDVRLPEVIKAAVKADIAHPLDTITQSTQPPRAEQEQKPAAPQRKISMIVIGDVHKMAVIDGNLVHEGDSIGGFVVKKIERDRVLVKNNENDAEEKTDETQQWLYLEDIP